MEEPITFLLAFVSRISEFLPLVGITLLCILLISIILRATLTLLAFRWQITRPKAYLELTPPASATKKAYATQELFSVLHGLDSTRSWNDRQLRRRSTLSLEIISTHTEGVRYVIGVPVEEQKNVQRMVHSYLPEAKVALIDHYIEYTNKKKVSIISFNQTRHFAFPLLPQSSLEEHDPIAYVTGAMTKLEPGEMITYQLTITPRTVNEARSIATKILSNEHTVSSLGKRSSGILQKIAYTVNSLIFSILDGFSSSGSSNGDTLSRHRQEVAMKLKPARVLTTFEQELIESIHQKVSQPLFQVSVRVAVNMNDSARQNERVKSMRNSLSSFNSPGYQALSVSKWITARMMNRLNTYLFTHRLPSLQSDVSNLFAASEVSDLYHFPFTGTTNTENLVKSLSRLLPAPLSLKTDPKLDVVIGMNEYHGTKTSIGLTEQERERHVYIIGGTGNGKTTLLQYAIVQDIKNGQGLAVIDPHGDMAETILD
ncbi:type IV secretion system DNA-binding domain-containing protein, partial [Candidatus Saccharibacteria bacterium]|nr:type IV secretion system DNA-binding domain-containing protein [Candidatus Saccharibacteria bacterium]